MASREESSSRLVRHIPIVGWMRHYDRSWLPPDLLAGLTLWAILVPQALARTAV